MPAQGIVNLEVRTPALRTEPKYFQWMLLHFSLFTFHFFTSSIFPMVCTEGEERHVPAITDIPDLEILETITYRHRFFDLW